MSRQAGKVRDPAVKRQTRTTKRGEHTLEQQEALDLEAKVNHLQADSSHHDRLLTRRDKSNIQTSVAQLQIKAERLKSITSNPYKSRSRQLDTVEEMSKHSSSEPEGEESHSRLGSIDTERYTILSSPFTTSQHGKSPLQVDQPPPAQFQHTSPLVNPQFSFNPPPAMPSVSANPVGPMTIMQSMFAQQAIANRQQQEAMMAQQAQISRQQAEANQQLQLLLAKSLDRQIDQQDRQLVRQTDISERQAIYDARVAIKTMREGTTIVQYLEHFETEVGDAQIPLSKWKHILVSKLSVKAEKVCAHLINSDATYQDLKRHLLANTCMVHYMQSFQTSQSHKSCNTLNMSQNAIFSV